MSSRTSPLGPLVEAAIGARPKLPERSEEPGKPAEDDTEQRRVYAPDAGIETERYHEWLATRRPRRHGRSGPVISVVVPVFRPDISHLEACIRSVRQQSYDDWELCVCDDASGLDRVELALARLEHEGRHDRRVRVIRRTENGGISRATNDAAALASGDFLAFLDQDDLLEPDVLASVATAVAGVPTADVLYTDQDILDAAGDRIEPYFKPGWSPDLLQSNMYLGHLLVIRRTTFDEVGRLRPERDGSQDYDLALRATEAARAVEHVPMVGYHWRRSPGSTALHYEEKPEADVAARASLRDAAARRGVDAVVEPGLVPTTFRVRRRVPPDLALQIAVPFDDHPTRLAHVVADLQSAWPRSNLEVSLIDVGSWKPETHAIVRRLCRQPGVEWRTAPLDEVDGDLLLVVSPWVTPVGPGWIDAMAEHALRPEVGAVGARLVHPDGRVAHVGVVPGLAGRTVGLPFADCPPTNNGYWGLARMVRNCTAVTGACLMTSRSAFEDVGGWDLTRPLGAAGLEYCGRQRQRGRLVVATPFAELRLDAPSLLEAEENPFPEVVAAGSDIWEGPVFDPYFNPNLDPQAVEFRLPPA